MLKILGVSFLVVLAFAMGAWNGWDTGVSDARNMEVCHVQP